jgi:hypothetical protein
LEELVEENNNEGSGDELDNEKETDTCTEVSWLTVEPGENVDSCLTEGNDEGED